MNITENKRFITTTELANMLNTTNDVILNCARRCNINKNIKNGVATYWNEEEATIILNEFKNGNKSNNRSFELNSKVNITTTGKENELIMYKINEESKQLDLQEQIKLSFQLQANIIQQLNKENEELKNWKTEKLYIENEKYQSKELRTKINKRIRQIARDTDSKHSDIWNKYFSIYSNIHCFSGKQSLDLIQDRHHLKEFYNLTLTH